MLTVRIILTKTAYKNLTHCEVMPVEVQEGPFSHPKKTFLLKTEIILAMLYLYPSMQHSVISFDFFF